MRLHLGIDVGTRSARAGLFDDTGKMHASAAREIQVFRPAPDFAEHSSDDIWRACCEATRAALALAGVAPNDPSQVVAGIGFDATCSLVALGEGDAPISVSPTGKPEQNVIVWMDHRATDQAQRINATKHEVLEYVGGVISPEMQMPKLLWLKENLPEGFRHARRFFDLPDFLVYRATGNDVRSLCTTVCKWTYLGHAGGWSESFLRDIGLGEFVDEGYARIGTRIRPLGERAGVLGEAAARDLGLAVGTPVGVAIIDAHAGGLGLLGAAGASTSASVSVSAFADAAGSGAIDIEQCVALIGGTSSCHMAVSRERKFVPGVWGPYFGAMVPGMWLTEGGQSATGALVDHVIASHARGAELAREAAARGTSSQALLNERLEALAAVASAPFLGALARDLHVLPDHHGNRSPRADATLRGMVSGLSLESDIDALALLYLATVQAIAHGTKHILDAMRAAGLPIETIAMCGGDAKNPLFVREHADVTGCRIVLPQEPEAVLLGAAILGRVASDGSLGRSETLIEAMTAMDHAGTVIDPASGAVADFHARKHQVFLRMHADHVAYRELMLRREADQFSSSSA